MNASIQNPLVSIGILTYNRPIGLRKALECITAQTYSNLEIIIGDNASFGEDTELIVHEFMEKDPRISYYRHSENMGGIYNWMFVLGKAKGNYFMWACDDDYLQSETLVEELVRFAPSHILTFPEINFSANKDKKLIYNAYKNCETDEDYLFAWLNSLWGPIVYGIYNLKLFYKHNLKFEYDNDLSYFCEGTFLHKLFITGNVKFVPGQYIYYEQGSPKPTEYNLCYDFAQYFYRSRKLFKKSNLGKANKKRALKLLKTKFYPYLFQLFLYLKLSEKKKVLQIVLKMPDIYLQLIYRNIKEVFFQFLRYRRKWAVSNIKNSLGLTRKNIKIF